MGGDDDAQSLKQDLKNSSADEINQRIRLLDNEVRIMKSE